MRYTSCIWLEIGLRTELNVGSNISRKACVIALGNIVLSVIALAVVGFSCKGFKAQITRF